MKYFISTVIRRENGSVVHESGMEDIAADDVINILAGTTIEKSVPRKKVSQVVTKKRIRRTKAQIAAENGEQTQEDIQPVENNVVGTELGLSKQQFDDMRAMVDDEDATSMQVANEMNVELAEINFALPYKDFSSYIIRRKSKKNV